MRYIRHRALRECVSGSCGLCLFLSYCYTYCIACSLTGKCNLDPIRIITGDPPPSLWVPGALFGGSKTGSVLDTVLDRFLNVFGITLGEQNRSKIDLGTSIWQLNWLLHRLPNEKTPRRWDITNIMVWALSIGPRPPSGGHSWLRKAAQERPKAFQNGSQNRCMFGLSKTSILDRCLVPKMGSKMGFKTAQNGIHLLLGSLGHPGKGIGGGWAIRERGLGEEGRGG